ncbi:MAG: LysR substrate-binding domain-containing protein [Cypionkella sp.]|uniref:LysR substrate-binding domain-containing protein n=1 Tax=Cypionkella sp. TaxID=2811411 RepID=UPI002ABAFE28|nr:LysR substrate-binding domain-containing protein [Cypionkella sp.]MDZ4311512.1 LysR substrate-binding domain-containing protein [Cypionkella sp.]MDZ4395613.1 LysR substrate-binding domain-containing protein [Cypionkella sp.]
MKSQRLPPLRLFAVFETVLRSGSPQRAAAELNVSQPAISQAIKALETHIGAALLDRRSRPPALTEAGRILQRAVADGLGRITDAIEQIHALQRVSPGSVTVACSVGTATYWLMPRLSGFYVDHSDVSVNVMTTAQGAPAITAGIDLAIRYGLGNWSDGRVIKLFEESVVPVCHPSLRQRMLDAGLGIAGLPLLHVNSGEDSWLSWQDYLRAVGLPEPRGGGRSFTNYVQATQAALDGHGVMLGWDSNTADLLRRGRLVVLPFPKLQPKEAFYLVLPAHRDDQPAVRRLADWLCRPGAASAPSLA